MPKNCFFVQIPNLSDRSSPILGRFFCSPRFLRLRRPGEGGGGGGSPHQRPQLHLQEVKYQDPFASDWV